MKTQLRAPAELFDISVLAEVAVWEPRPELQRLLQSGQAGGKVQAANVDAALPGLTRRACQNVLKTIEHMQLITADGSITALGEYCRASGEAPSWELGVFTFLVAQHPCCGAWPIAFRREKPDGYDSDVAGLQALPTWFIPAPMEIWTSGFEGGTRFTIARFPTLSGQARCRTRGRDPATLLWRMDLGTGENRLHLEGDIHVDGESIPFKTHEVTVPKDEVREYFSSWEPRWNQAAGRVLCAYDGAAKDGRDDFVRSITYPRITADRRGTFDAVRVEDVPVGPSGPAEARAWATALALARVSVADSYAAPTTWAKEWNEFVAGTPLRAGAGAAPEVCLLLDSQRALSPRLRWLLATGTDLAME